MTTKLNVKDHEIVVPGQVLATGMDYLPSKGTYRQEDKILASRVGLVQLDGKVLKTIPLSGRYLPKRGDTVVGRVSDVLMSGWRINIDTMYDTVLMLKDATSEFIKRGEDLTRYFQLDDYVACKIVNVTSQNLIDVSMRGPGLRKLRGGTFHVVPSNKVPRIIGKKGSMVTMIKKATDCDVVVGQNGVSWINGEPEMEVLAINTINLIVNHSHLPGLTEFIKEYLEAETGKELE